MNRITFLTNRTELANDLRAEFDSNNFACSVIMNSNLSPISVVASNADLILVDLISKPELRDLCREVKDIKDVPILAIASPEIVLEHGSYIDDFVTDVFKKDEIIWRTKRLLQKANKFINSNEIRIKGLLINLKNYEVSVNGRLINLTFREFDLLRFLILNPGRVFTRDELLNHIWGKNYFGGDRAVDVQIQRLRGKIEDSDVTFIDTVRNVGYRFKKF